MPSNLYLGIDACPYGWITLIIEKNRGWELEIFEDIEQLWTNYDNASIILIDIPIGLRSKGGEPRICDAAARDYLGKRSSCIFPTPCRKALRAVSYEEANKINRELTGKGLSKQTYNIMPKIREVDYLLTSDEKASNLFIECQPEVCFTALNNNQPLKYYKKKKKGIQQRLELLQNHWDFDENPFEIGKKRFNRSEVAIDDILDAWVLGISAALGKDKLKFLPKNYEHDSKGLPMRMAVPEFGYNN
jgi:predicted RNase H-like nuclease